MYTHTASVYVCTAVRRNVSICSLKKRIQINSTLFPYTTLFRSPNARVQWSGYASLAIPDRRKTRHRCQLIDRKSTRLNSSHTVISYAVFCLKIKKSKNVRHRDIVALLREVCGRLVSTNEHTTEM